MKLSLVSKRSYEGLERVQAELDGIRIQLDREKKLEDLVDERQKLSAQEHPPETDLNRLRDVKCLIKEIVFPKLNS